MKLFLLKSFAVMMTMAGNTVIEQQMKDSYLQNMRVEDLLSVQVGSPEELVFHYKLDPFPFFEFTEGKTTEWVCQRLQR